MLPQLLGLTIALSALAAEPANLLVDEKCAGPDLPAKWEPAGRPHSFRFVDGALCGICQPDDPHGPAMGVPIEGPGEMRIGDVRAWENSSKP